MIKIAYLALALISNAWAGYYFTPEQVFPQRPLNFFWSSSGNDSNNCLSPSQACQTITHFNAFSFPQGATAHFHGGDTFSGGLVIATTGITVTSYGTGQPIISSGNSAACVSATNIAGVTVNNLDCVGGGNSTNSTSGILLLNSLTNTRLQGAIVTSNTISGYGVMGIWVNGNAGSSGFNNVTVNNNTVHDSTGNDDVNAGNYTSCIYVGNQGNNETTRTAHTNVSINNNTVFNCQGTPATVNNASGTGITLQSATTGTISNNFIHDYGASNTHCNGPAGLTIQDVDSITVQFNEIYRGSNGSGGACDGEALDLDANNINSVFQYNYVHDMLTADGDALICSCSANAALPFNNNTFRFNIIVNNAGVHPSLIVAGGTGVGFGALTNLFIYNNTIYNAGSPPLITLATGSPNGSQWTGEVANNIFYNTSGNTITVGMNPNVLFAGNDYFNTGGFSVSWNGTTYATLALFRAGASQETVSASPVGTSVNPNLLNPGGHSIVGGYFPPGPVGYHPLGGSPVLPNAGLNLNTDFSINPGTQDFYGSAVTASTLPIGAGATVFSGGGTSSITLVHHNLATTGGGSSLTTTITGTTAANSLIVGIVYCQNAFCSAAGGTVPASVTSSNPGETCTEIPGTGITQFVSIDVWYCPNIVGGSDSITVNMSAGAFFMGNEVVEINGASSSRPVDSVNSITTNSAAFTSYSIPTGDATVNASEFIYSMGDIAGGSFSGFTFGQTQIAPPPNTLDEYQISGAAGSVYSNTASWTGSGEYSVAGVAFK